MLQRKWPHTSLWPPRAIAFSSKPQFPFPSGFTSRPPYKRQTCECHCPHPLTPTHAADVWVSLNHDRKCWRHRGGRRGGPLPGAARRSRILRLFMLPCEGWGRGPAGRGSWDLKSRETEPVPAAFPSLSLLSSPAPHRILPVGPLDEHPNSYPALSEVFGRKRKKRTSIETNIRLTLEKRFQDVSRSLGWGQVG